MFLFVYLIMYQFFSQPPIAFSTVFCMIKYIRLFFHCIIFPPAVSPPRIDSYLTAPVLTPNFLGLLCNCDPRNSLYLILVVGAPFLDFMSCLSVTFALKTKQNKTKKANWMRILFIFGWIYWKCWWHYSTALCFGDKIIFFFF